MWVKQQLTTNIICDTIDFKLGNAIYPNPKVGEHPFIAYCDPNPTHNPAIISLSGEVLSVYLSESKGENSVKC